LPVFETQATCDTVGHKKSAKSARPGSSSLFRGLPVVHQVGVRITIELSTKTQKTLPVNIFLRYLKSTFPEEAVADLVAFRNRLSQAKIPRRIIYWKLFIEVLKLIPDIHIQIKIENLWLPPGNRRVDK
jgi:hypothetical protein